jgi:subtilase family serine protease
MKTASRRFFKVFGLFLLVFAVSIQVAPTRSLSAPGPYMVQLQGHIPRKAVANARWIERLRPEREISLAFALPLRNQQELSTLLSRIYDPDSPLYGQYLTPEEFTERFAPTQSDYDTLINYAIGLGFKITGTHPNRTLLDVSASAATVDAAFGIALQKYQTHRGRDFHAPDRNPQVPDFIASRIVGIIGLDNAAVWHAHSNFAPAETSSSPSPNQIGTGPGGGLAPGDIRKAYNLDEVSANGSGQTLGLFELDGYRSSDVAYYVNYYKLPSVPLQNVLIDGFSGRAGSGASEVTLDIELQIALAPGASKIIVYEGPNTNTGVVDTYNRIATDNLAKQISTSWGLSEGQSSRALINSENAIFMQMAVQGQSIYAAAGDSGAYDDGFTISVDDPASQPYMVGVGGTQLYVLSDESYDHESTWNVDNTVDGGAGGGGISSIWAIPDYQQGIAGIVSTTKRNVPDVSLNSDQYTGYSVYYNGRWYIFGGTSCAAPLWAAFTARVNQVLSENGSPPLGFANPALYGIAKGAQYQTDFHDIADGSTNLHYVAGNGYDNATGWGSFHGANLLADLTGGSSTLPPGPPTGLKAVAGNGTVTLSWTASTGATTYNIYRGTTSGGEGATPIKSGISGTTYTDGSLTNGKTYYYRVSASNSAGASGLSDEVSATPAAQTLTITRGPTVKLSRGSAVISWTTNPAADSHVAYGTSPSQLSRTAGSTNLVTSHSVSLTSLSRRTVYYYLATSTLGGATVSGGVRSFTAR